LIHGSRFLSGNFYTGARYGKEHNLWVVFFEYARRWLALARTFGPGGSELDYLETTVASEYDPRQFDLISINLLPDIYRSLPWFAYQPINVVTEFIPFDMVTLGAHPALTDRRYTLHRQGDVNIWATNHPFDKVDDMMTHLETHPVQIVNLVDPSRSEGALEALASVGKFLVFIVDMTGCRRPLLCEPFVHGTIVDPRDIVNFSTYQSYLSGQSFPVKGNNP
jgi:hypothetical protein